MKLTHIIDTHRHRRAPFVRAGYASARPGFSITEMLVVVGIIVLLASLLMVAMGRVRNSALQSQTLSIMQNFAAACDSFQTEHGMYPGVIPEAILAERQANLVANNDTSYTGPITFTGTENALLHLMGGYRALPPGVTTGQLFDDYGQYSADFEIHFGTVPNAWQLKIRLSDIGQGPIINGRSYPSYYTPGPNEVAVVAGQYLQTDAVDQADWVRIPDLVDAWGQPIIYIRQIRTSGPLVSDVPDDRPQFLFGPAGSNRAFGGMTGYLRAANLGGSGMDQDDQYLGSIFNVELDRDVVLGNFAQIVRHPAFGSPEEPLSPANVQRVAARGAYVLISAGSDGVYFSAADGPGRPGDPVSNLNDGSHANPRLVEDYDDIIFFGGG